MKVVIELEIEQQKHSNWIDETFFSIPKDESEDILEVIQNNRINKEVDSNFRSLS